jgi:hypothetical protein
MARALQDKLTSLMRTLLLSSGVDVQWLRSCGSPLLLSPLLDPASGTLRQRLVDDVVAFAMQSSQGDMEDAMRCMRTMLDSLLSLVVTLAGDGGQHGGSAPEGLVLPPAIAAAAAMHMCGYDDSGGALLKSDERTLIVDLVSHHPAAAAVVLVE